MDSSLYTTNLSGLEKLVLKSGNLQLSFDLFKSISDKSMAIGSLLGTLGYFYYRENNMSDAFNRSLIPACSILGFSYFGMDGVIGETLGAIGGSYIANGYYLPSYQSITNSEMLYETGSAIIGSYLFKYIFDNFIYKPSPSA